MPENEFTRNIDPVLLQKVQADIEAVKRRHYTRFQTPSLINEFTREIDLPSRPTPIEDDNVPAEIISLKEVFPPSSSFLTETTAKIQKLTALMYLILLLFLVYQYLTLMQGLKKILLYFKSNMIFYIGIYFLSYRF